MVPREGLFDRLSAAQRVTHLSAPAGSGKTSLLRAWIVDGGLDERTAWVSIGDRERDPQTFWLSVMDALRNTAAGATRVGALTAAPGLDGWRLLERLLDDLSSLDAPLWLVIDDVHELEDADALEQLELLLSRAPAELRFVLATRRDLRLGLHRLRLEGELTEIRATDLRFTPDESRALLEAVGVNLSGTAIDSLVARTEGWAAGLRLAALSLAGHADPERFAVEFSGSERGVAEYLFAEVLEHEPREVTRLLLRTSMLERVNGPLADRLTGSSGGGQILAELEDAGAFVVSLDTQRSWYRYHRLFADMLALELQRTAPEEVPGLHTEAAEWFAEHGYPLEAVRHAQAARNWALAARVLSDSWFGIFLDGHRDAVVQVLDSFPAGVLAADAELLAARGSLELPGGSLDEAERYLALATQQSASVPNDRRGRLEATLTSLRLGVARARNDLSDIDEQARLLLVPAQPAAQSGIGADVRLLALINLGIAEASTDRFEAAADHLEEALALAQRTERPLLRVWALAHWGRLASFRSLSLAEERCEQAIELAEAHGWSELPVVGIAYTVLGTVMLWRGRLQEAERLLDRAEKMAEVAEPTVALMFHTSRGLLEFARGRYDEALRAFGAAERVGGLLMAPDAVATRAQAQMLQIRVRLGQADRVERSLAAIEEHAREAAEMRVVVAELRLAQGDAEGAAAVLEAFFDSPAGAIDDGGRLAQARLLEAIVRDALRDAGAASRALEQALDAAERSGLLLPFLLLPTHELLERHARSPTAHASLVREILIVLSGNTPAARSATGEALTEPLSDSELRILRYLPTNLPAPEIAGELFVSVNTVRTHMRHLYAKLGVHKRAEAVERARQLGLLSLSGRSR